MTLFARNAPCWKPMRLPQRASCGVGLGSGGSTMADLVARSGVGHFLCIGPRQCGLTNLASASRTALCGSPPRSSIRSGRRDGDTAEVLDLAEEVVDAIPSDKNCQRA